MGIERFDLAIGKGCTFVQEEHVGMGIDNEAVGLERLD